MSNPFPPKNHSIPLQQAIDMTKRYRDNKEKILAPGVDKETLALCETFSTQAVSDVISQAGAVSFRIYYGMDDNLKIHAILVGVDEEGKDLLPTSGSFSAEFSNEFDTDTDPPIEEDAYRCPPSCPPESSLNTP
ncbi:MAG: hypothetical protein JWN76_472 [Chitinophagaceae bacterium]|nr:hypothetical protein [Chitinophagaceae bacterium]